MITQFEHGSELSEIVHVYDVSGKAYEVYNDIADEHFMIAMK